MTISIKPTASGSTIEQDGSTILTVDGSGNIDVANNLTVAGSSLIPSVPAFKVNLLNPQTLSTNAWQKVGFDTVVFDTNSNYNTTTERYTPTVAGYYQFSASVGRNTDINLFLVSFYKNGAEDSRGSFGGDYTSAVTVSSLIYMNGTTDYIEVYVYNGSGTGSIHQQTPRTHFEGVLVSV